ncbi:siderophore-interacting protein [Agrobacterium larrymoorei]|uniref:NADPH-dependent ferric siderophore reductase n=1 Tax=Agrobacterium larrymoorei TaxID=160699 RepID=A0ABU0UHR5_9HYPH|nr:siderophore-interacting protein [Agrobacterium larrymoorei]MDQ1184480.1 NADPH-dependent ferric siderophore reductase [Agrobacterium larrymoorei]
MNAIHLSTLSGIASPADVNAMLAEICEHFVEHSDVVPSEHGASLRSEDWAIDVKTANERLLIEIRTENEEMLAATRTMFAEHLFYFAGDEPFMLEWSKPAPKVRPPGFYEATVLGSEDVTPRMRRVILKVSDVTPFIGGDIHVRLLVPPLHRTPVWPKLKENGSIGWPDGEDELLVRAYTIRSVDEEAKLVSIDFLQHPKPGVATPGADFARDAQPGQRVALMGPGSGHLPEAKSILFAGDETSLPAIARMVEEAPTGTTIKAIIEVEDAAEEQAIRNDELVSVEWLHRSTYGQNGGNDLVERLKAEIDNIPRETFVWFAGEKSDVRTIKRHLAEKERDRKQQYVAWYWSKED